MELTLAHHPITEIQFGSQTRLNGIVLVVDPEELRRVVLEDEFILNADFEIARPGESCRAGPVFDVIEPRAKAPGSSPDFPGILGPPTTAGIGTTHVLGGAAVSVLAERGPGESRSATGRFLEMSGVAAEGTEYSLLQHLVVILRTRPGLPNQRIEKAYRRAGLKIAVQIASVACDHAPASTQTFAPAGPMEEGGAGLPR